jgi:hypothetical protein
MRVRIRAVGELRKASFRVLAMVEGRSARDEPSRGLVGDWKAPKKRFPRSEAWGGWAGL